MNESSNSDQNANKVDSSNQGNSDSSKEMQDNNTHTVSDDVKMKPKELLEEQKHATPEVVNNLKVVSSSNDKQEMIDQMTIKGPITSPDPAGTDPLKSKQILLGRLQNTNADHKTSANLYKNNTEFKKNAMNLSSSDSQQKSNFGSALESDLDPLLIHKKMQEDALNQKKLI